MASTRHLPPIIRNFPVISFFRHLGVFMGEEVHRPDLPFEGDAPPLVDPERIVVEDWGVSTDPPCQGQR